MVNIAGLPSARSSRLPNTFFELLSLLLAMTRGCARRLRMITPDQDFSCPVQSAISGPHDVLDRFLENDVWKAYCSRCNFTFCPGSS